MSDQRRILGLDEDKQHQAAVAQAFSQAGFFYRFVTEGKKALPAVRKMRPELLLIHGEVRSPLVVDTLSALQTDVELAHLPVALLCTDLTDAPFLRGLRSGIVSLMPLPFVPSRDVEHVRALLDELPSRAGSVSGGGDSLELANLVEHVRRTLRSGLLTLELPEGGRTIQGRAAFVKGQLESAELESLRGVEALVTMVAAPYASWKFTEVAGAPGDGAGVVIEVAPATEEQEEVVAIVDDEPLSFEPAPRPSRMALLLVDDDETLCEMFRRLFEKHGLSVATARDGIEGYRAALTGRFDAVIADLSMPRMDGWGLLKMLRDDFRTRELPVAFLSCHDDYRDSLKALQVGAAAYFAKGARLDGLVDKVRALAQPRADVSRALSSGRDAPIAVAAVGPQWLLRELARLCASGRLDVKDGWMQLQIFLRHGSPFHAYATAGRYSAEGERALFAFVASKAAEARFTRGDFAVPQTLTGSLEAMLSRACAVLNENERQIREGLLVRASRISVDDALYEVYARVGPSQWLEIARLICQEKLPPREILARVDASPVEVEDVIRDLVRRGVVTLTA